MKRDDNLLKLLRSKRRSARRGVTLFEVLIVLAIMALIAGGVGFMLLPKLEESRLKKAQIDAKSIRQVALQWIALKGSGNECPTVQSLIAEKELQADEGGKDPWGTEYVIQCSADDVAVSSAGKDKQMGTEDDVTVGTAGGAG